MANRPHTPLGQRVDAVMPVLDARRAHRPAVMYAFNITDELDAMQRHHDTCCTPAATA